MDNNMNVVDFNNMPNDLNNENNEVNQNVEFQVNETPDFNSEPMPQMDYQTNEGQPEFNSEVSVEPISEAPQMDYQPQPEVQQPMYQEPQQVFEQPAQFNPGPMPDPVQPQMNYEQPIPTTQPNQNVNPTDTPVINVEQTPTEVFGAPVNPQPMNNQVGPNPIIDIQPVEEKPKYGYVGSEHKADLNEGSNANITFIIILAILMFAFIIFLPYISKMIG